VRLVCPKGVRTGRGATPAMNPGHTHRGETELFGVAARSHPETAALASAARRLEWLSGGVDRWWSGCHAGVQGGLRHCPG
jgi:hypothetical protein